MQLGKYEIIEELGRGGFGIVYKALDPTLKREVALKVMHPQLAVDLNFVNRFHKEALSLAALDHQNIVSVYEFDQAEGHYYICMRFIPGGNLAQFTQKVGSLDQKSALPLFHDIVAGLSYAHQKGVVHRDIKPQNILLDQTGRAIITDFGLASLAQLSSSASSSLGTSAIGTPYYRAPEVWQGERATQASDQYSLACVFVEMLTGAILFNGRTTPMVMMKHFEPLVLPGNIDDRLKPVLMRALSKDPKNRYPNLDEFEKALSASIKSEENQDPVIETTRKIGHYKILGEISRSSSGTNYKALHENTNALVTLKVLDPFLVSNTDYLAKLRRQIQLNSPLQHPNISKIRDYGEESGYFFVAVDYMPGGSLEDLIHKKGKLDDHQFLIVTRQILSGLTYLHDHGVIHSNLNPENIYFGNSGQAVVSDYGLGLPASDRTSLSLGAEVGANLAYIAPEIWRGEKATKAADIYSLGCIWYEMLAGKPLVENRSAFSAMHTHLDAKKIFRAQQSNIPEKFREMIALALDSNPAVRSKSLDLIRYTDFSGVPKKEPGKKKVLPKIIWGAASLTLVACIVLAAVLLNGKTKPPPTSYNTPNQASPTVERITPNTKTPTRVVQSDSQPAAVIPSNTSAPVIAFSATSAIPSLTPIRFTATATQFRTATPSKYYYAGCPTSQLRVGDSSFVSFVGSSNRIRSTPDSTDPDNEVARAQPGEVLLILDGPECDVYGYIWWKVLTTFGDVGWTPESPGKEFWLIPIATRQLCPGALPSRIVVGDKAKVQEDPPLENFLFEFPDTGSLALSRIQPGGEMIILDGPDCSSNYNWWWVQSLLNGKTGWTREGNSKDYFIAPIIEPNN